MSQTTSNATALRFRRSTEYEYLLRLDADGLRAYVAVSLDEAGKLAELAASRGVTLG